MPYQYRPMLKTKAGEATALENLSNPVKSRIQPVFHVTTTVAPSFGQALANAWGNRSIAVDGRFSFNTSGSTAPFTATVQSLRNRGIPVVPSISTDAHARLVTAAMPLINATGVMVRTPWYGLPTVAAFVGAAGWQSPNVDLVIDVGDVSASSVPALATAIATSVNQQIGAQHPYRSVTLAASAAPKDHGGLPYGRSNVPRRDWELWNLVRQQVPFQLDYADYGTGHPDLTEPPGVAMASATVSARYTGANDWLIIKGRRTTGAQGIPMPQQYRGHAAHYVADPQFGGVPNCWADGRIQQINSGATTPGNRTTWSAIAANRHMMVVGSQLP